MRTALLLALILGGCVDGLPYDPCPTVTVYMSVDTVFVTDSIVYGCP